MCEGSRTAEQLRFLRQEQQAEKEGEKQEAKKQAGQKKLDNVGGGSALPAIVSGLNKFYIEGQLDDASGSDVASANLKWDIKAQLLNADSPLPIHLPAERLGTLSEELAGMDYFTKQKECVSEVMKKALCSPSHVPS